MNEHGMNEHGINENEIRDLLGEGIGEEPPIVGGPAAVFAGARRQTVRTRAIAGALSAVAVLGIAGGAVAFGDAAGKSGASRPGATASSADQVPIDGRSVAEILKLELPSGLTTSDYGGMDPGVQNPSSAAGVMMVDDGTGKPVLLAASVGRKEYEPISDLACDDTEHKELAGISGCQAHMEPDGSVVLVYRVEMGFLGADGRPLGSYALLGERLFPNHLSVRIEAGNWFAPPSEPTQQADMAGPSRPAPILSRDQLEQMVMNPRWGFTVSADFARQAQTDITPYVDQSSKN